MNKFSRFLTALAATPVLMLAAAGAPALAGGGSDTTGEGFHCYAFFTFDDDPDKFVQAMINEEFADVAEEKINEVLDKYEDEGATVAFLVGNVVGVCEGTHPCSAVPEKLVFVSSTTTDGDMGGIEMADQTCNDLASDASLPGDYLAWLSDSTTSPNARFTRSDGPYVRVDGVVVAFNYEDLIDFNIFHSISVDEQGSNVGFGNGVWTGTQPNGDALSSSTCFDWMSTTTGGTRGEHGVIGDPTATFEPGEWTNFANRELCDVPRRIYCFEQ